MSHIRILKTVFALSSAAAALAASSAWAQAQPETSAATDAPAEMPVLQDAQDDTTGQDIVVQGFRASLSSAINIKRNETATVDVIKADDVAEFPDLNLAESLQRIPGVAISRVNGEGRNISVRGLGPE